MRKTMCKLFWVWDFDKEEEWLNEMTAKGLALVAVGYCKYIFEECTPGEYNVRLELLENIPTHAESEQYIKFVEETGAEYLGAVMRWVYFRRKTDNGAFNLYSDNASRVKHLSRILALLAFISLMSLCAGCGNIAVYFSTNSILHLACGIAVLIFGLFSACGFIRVFLKKQKIKKQQNLFE